MFEYTLVSKVVANVPSDFLNILYCAKALGIQLLFLSLMKQRDFDVLNFVKDS